MLISREDFLLDAIYDDVCHRLNPGDEECFHCGGEGYIYDCIDGCCFDAEAGCEDCARRCQECVRYERNVRRAVQLEVLRDLNVDLAIAFLKRNNKWSEKISAASVLLNLHAGRAAHKEFSAEERADSACWVEGLL